MKLKTHKAKLIMDLKVNILTFLVEILIFHFDSKITLYTEKIRRKLTKIFSLFLKGFIQKGPSDVDKKIRDERLS